MLRIQTRASESHVEFHGNRRGFSFRLQACGISPIRDRKAEPSRKPGHGCVPMLSSLPSDPSFPRVMTFAACSDIHGRTMRSGCREAQLAAHKRCRRGPQRALPLSWRPSPRAAHAQSQRGGLRPEPPPSGRLPSPCCAGAFSEEPLLFPTLASHTSPLKVRALPWH